MELYTLDGLLRRTEIVEGFESFIWTERYSDIGRLSIVTPSTQQFRNLLPNGTFLGLSESRRVMVVDTIEDKETDGVKKLYITAKELTNIFKDRLALTGTAGTEPGHWKAVGEPSDIIRTLFDYTCRDGSLTLTDKLPLMDPGSLYASGNLPEDTNVYSVERPYSDLFSAVKELADVWDLGFRLYKGDDNSKLYFDVYKGNDRTTNQSTLNPVIFSEDLDSLQEVSELTSVATSKNVAYVRNNYTAVTVYAIGASDTTSGFTKRTLYVDGTDIDYAPRSNTLTSAQEIAINKALGLKETLTPERDALQKLLDKERFTSGEAALIPTFTSAQVTATRLTAGEKTDIDAAATASTALEAAELTAMQALMAQRGEEELAKNRSISAFDGQITQLSPYKYNRDYDMGDLVEMRNSSGLTNQMLVTEQIFVSDEEGERAYPTLTIKLFITPGSWLAWENTQTWLDAPGTWSEA